MRAVSMLPANALPLSAVKAENWSIRKLRSRGRFVITFGSTIPRSVSTNVLPW